MIRLAAIFALLIGCSVAGDAPIELDSNKADSAFIVSLSADKPISSPSGTCESDFGCRVKLRTLPRSNDFLRAQPDGAHSVATLQVTSGEELIIDSEIRWVNTAGAVNFDNWKHEFILPSGPFVLDFIKAPQVPEVGIDLNFRARSIASPVKREECHRTCGDYIEGQCLTSELADACHLGCSVTSAPEASAFATCGSGSIDTCDTFCFINIPGVNRFSGGCDDFTDPCPDGYSCHSEVCLPED